MQSYKKGITKHPQSEGKSGKVYIGETLKRSIELYNEQNLQNGIPPIECSGKTYTYRLLAAAGRELESSELLHNFYGWRSFHEIEMIMSTKKYEFLQEIRRICESLAERFPHVVLTADLWAALEAVKRKLCDRKAEYKRSVRKRESTAQGSSQVDSGARKRTETAAAKKAEHLVEARRRKAESRKRAKAIGVNDEALANGFNGDTENTPKPSVLRTKSAETEQHKSQSFSFQSESSEEEVVSTLHVEERTDWDGSDSHASSRCEARELKALSQSLEEPCERKKNESSVTGSLSGKNRGKRNQDHAVTAKSSRSHCLPTTRPTPQRKKCSTKSVGSAKRKKPEPEKGVDKECKPSRKRRNTNVPTRYREQVFSPRPIAL